MDEMELPVAELVPGDVVRLKAGDLMPADARLLDVKDLHVRESVLTGESLPIEKTATSQLLALAWFVSGAKQRIWIHLVRLPMHNVLSVLDRVSTPGKATC